MKFLVLTAVSMKKRIFLKVTPLNLSIDNVSQKSAAFELKRNGTASSETLSLKTYTASHAARQQYMYLH